MNFIKKERSVLNKKLSKMDKSSVTDSPRFEPLRKYVELRKKYLNGDDRLRQQFKQRDLITKRNVLSKVRDSVSSTLDNKHVLSDNLSTVRTAPRISTSQKIIEEVVDGKTIKPSLVSKLKNTWKSGKNGKAKIIGSALATGAVIAGGAKLVSNKKKKRRRINNYEINKEIIQ